MYRWRQPLQRLAIAVTAITVAAIALGLSAGGSYPPAATLAPAPPRAGTLDAVRLAAAASEPDQWFTPGGDASGAYYSPLADINVDNVSRLGFAWEYHLGSHRGLENSEICLINWQHPIPASCAC